MSRYFDDHFSAWVESTIKKIPEFTKQVANEAEKDPEWMGDISPGLSPDILNRAETATKDGQWYRNQIDYITSKYQTRLRAAFHEDAMTVYKDLFRNEVNAAKTVAQESDSDFYNRLADYDEEIVVTSEVKVSKEAVVFTDDAESAVRKFEKQAESDLGISEDLI